MVRAAEGMAPAMNAQEAANTLNGFRWMDAAASAMSPAGWDVLTRAAERTAPTMNAQEAANMLFGFGDLHPAASKLPLSLGSASRLRLRDWSITLKECKFDTLGELRAFRP